MSTQPVPIVPPTTPVKTIPTADEVRTQHTNDDGDVSPVSHHHTLGSAPGQAAPGNHTHDGGSSASINYGDISSTPGVPQIDYNNLMNLPVLNDYNNLINLPYIPPETPRATIVSGQVDLGYVGAGGYVNSTAWFGVNFASPPAVSVTAAGSSRITASIVSIGTTNASIQGGNNTAAATATATLYWTAIGYL